MTVRAPHFILFSESSRGRSASSCTEPERAEAEPAEGQWHFSLCTPDGTAKLDVAEREPEPSRDRLDLLAVVRGLEALDQPSRVTLVTSSGYVHRGLRFGLASWRRNAWRWERFGQMVPIKNRDLWQRVDRALEFHDVECRFARVDAAHDDLSASITRVETQADLQSEPKTVSLPADSACCSDEQGDQRQPRLRRGALAGRVVRWLWPVWPQRRCFAAAP